MMKAKFFVLIAAMTVAFSACTDTTDDMGSSLTPQTDRLAVTADTFNVTSQTILADSIMARNTKAYLGRVKDPESGDEIRASFMTQFHTLDNFTLPNNGDVYSRDEQGNVQCDSCEVELTYNTYYGDSLALMKTRAYILDEPMEEGVDYSTDYDPIKAGKVNKNGFYQDLSYTLSDQFVSDSLRRTSSYVKNVRVKLDKPFTKDGVTYNNYGTYVMRMFYQHPEYFHNNYLFTHNVMPGFYFQNTGGIGSMLTVNVPLFVFYFKYGEKADSLYEVSSSFAGTEEVLQTTTLSSNRERLKELAADRSCTYLKTPAGLYTEVTLPVEQIMSGHENDTVNTARLNIPRIVNQNPTEYTLDVPTSVLMIPEDSLYSFFANDRLPDYKTSYVSTYSSTRNSYLFGNISGMINNMYQSHLAGNRSANWNKVVLVPVTLETTTTSAGSTTIVNLSSNMSLTSTKLLGGADNPDALKLTVIYSKFNVR